MRFKNLLLSSVIAAAACFATVAQAAFLNAPVPSNAFIVFGGLDWAWASRVLSLSRRHSPFARLLLALPNLPRWLCSARVLPALEPFVAAGRPSLNSNSFFPRCGNGGLRAAVFVSH